MSDWKSVQAINVNAFAVAALGNGMLRVAFGESLDATEPSFHGALTMDREAAELLINLLRQGLEPPGSSAGGGGGSPGGPQVVLGSTTRH